MPAAVNTEPDTYPAYLALAESGELPRRVEAGLIMLSSCRACPRACNVDRLLDRSATCRIGRYAQVASSFAHLGEEKCLRGSRGSGTIFFSGCNLRCVFCQNWDISQECEGQEVLPGHLADIMLELQAVGAHNINWVTPEHVVPQILEALVPAVERGLRLPIVYNTSGFDSLESLRLLDGVVDIYMPDFKIWDADRAERYLKARDYPGAARQAIKEMHRQVGDLVLDENGLARRGLLVRHLVMPQAVADTREIAGWLADEISPHTYVNLMDQYQFAGEVARPNGEQHYPEIAQPVTADEFRAAQREARAAGLHRFDQ